jgi:putative endopeptidase
VLTDAAQAKVRTLLEPAAQQDRVGSIDRMIRDYYAAFMDESRIEHLGIAPLLPELKSIQEAKSRRALGALMGRENASLLGSIFHLDISPDITEPEHYSIQISQPVLGLPDRSYYLDGSYAAERKEYTTYISKLLDLANWPLPYTQAIEIVQFETSIAKASWSREQERDSAKTYNPVTLQGLEASVPDFAWGEFLRAAGLRHEERFILVEKTAIPQIAALYEQTPLATLQTWAAFALLDRAAPYLSKPIANAAFQMHERLLEGQKQPSPRWKQGLKLVSGGKRHDPSREGCQPWGCGRTAVCLALFQARSARADGRASCRGESSFACAHRIVDMDGTHNKNGGHAQAGEVHNSNWLSGSLA